MLHPFKIIVDSVSKFLRINIKKLWKKKRMPPFVLKSPYFAIILCWSLKETKTMKKNLIDKYWLRILEWPLSGKQFFPIRGQKFQVENIVLTCPYWSSDLNEVASEKVNRVLLFFHGMVLLTIARRSPCEIFSLASSGSWWSNSAKCSPSLVTRLHGYFVWN